MARPVLLSGLFRGAPAAFSKTNGKNTVADHQSEADSSAALRETFPAIRQRVRDPVRIRPVRKITP